jgi:hypothetical protein
MEKITTLASGILDQLENLDPAIAAKIQLAVSEIVEEAYGLSNAFALAVKSVGSVNATSPSPAAAPEVASTADTVTTDVAAPIQTADTPASHTRADGTMVQIVS